MKKRFVVAIDSMTPELENNMLEFIKEKKFGWWHWIDNFWLLVTYSADVSASSIRSELGKVIPNNKIVIEVQNPKGWAGYGPTGETNNMFKWMHDTWTKE